jgi:3-methyladenine DNA glycosylase AlkD
LETLELIEKMIREEFMWWDLCDPISINLVGRIALQNDLKSTLYEWIQ